MIFSKLATIYKAISTKNAPKELLENGAKECVEYGHEFPMIFPNETISRKQHVVSFVLPKYILAGTCYKMMKIEQKMENLHAEYNLLENKRKNEKNRAKRFFSRIKAHENKIKCSRERFNKKLKDYPNGKIPK